MSKAKRANIWRVLIAVDGSENSTRAVDYIVKQLGACERTVEAHLVNVQFPFSGNVSAFVDSETRRRFHEQEGLKALVAARARLDPAGIRYVFHVGAGEPAEVIARYAEEKGCDQIVMGTRGLGGVASMLLGSVAIKVIHLSKVPVLLIK